MVKLFTAAIALTDLKETGGVLSDLVQMVGAPLVILAVCGVALWRTARWLRPWVELVLKSHLKFVDGTSEKLDNLCAAVEQQSETISSHTASVNRLVNHLERKAG